MVDIMKEKKMKNNKGYGLFLCYIGCLISAILYSVIQSTLLGIFTTAVICICVLFVSEEDYYIFIFGLQFLRVVIPVEIGSSSFGFILFVYICLFLKIILEHKKIPSKCLFAVVLLLMDIVMSAVTGIFKIGDNINWVCSLVYMVYILKEKTDVIDFEKLLIFFCLAEWAVCLINIIAEYKIFGQSLVPEMYGVYTKELGAFAFGKAYSSIAGGNGISFNNAFAMAFCILQFPKAKRISTKIFYVITFIFFAYCGVMVISRAFYVEIIIFCFFYLLSLCKKPIHFVGFIVLLGIFILVFYHFMYDSLIINFERVLVRFERGNSNREALIEQAKILLESNLLVLLLGAGSYYPETYNFTAHNIFWDSIVSLGVFGFVLYWGVIFSSIYNCLKKKAKLGIKAITPLAMLFIYKIVSGSTRDVGFYYFIAMAVIYAVYLNNQEDFKKCRIKS